MDEIRDAGERKIHHLGKKMADLRHQLEDDRARADEQVMKSSSEIYCLIWWSYHYNFVEIQAGTILLVGARRDEVGDLVYRESRLWGDFCRPHR